MNYKFYANGTCTYVGNVEASSKEEALRKIKDNDYDDVEIVDDEMNKIECEKAVDEICEMCFKKHELEYGHPPINCAWRAFDNEDCPTVKVLKDLIQEHFDVKGEENETR